MRLAYADPPYLGCASHYKDHSEWKVYDSIDGHRRCRVEIIIRAGATIDGLRHEHEDEDVQFSKWTFEWFDRRLRSVGVLGSRKHIDAAWVGDNEA